MLDTLDKISKTATKQNNAHFFKNGKKLSGQKNIRRLFVSGTYLYTKALDQLTHCLKK